jgi:hypothetical protein
MAGVIVGHGLVVQQATSLGGGGMGARDLYLHLAFLHVE